MDTDTTAGHRDTNWRYGIEAASAQHQMDISTRDRILKATVTRANTMNWLFN